MFGGWLEAAEGVFDGGWCEGREVCSGLPHHPFGERGAGSDGRRATSNLVADLGHAVVFEAGSEAQHVSASDIAHIHRDGGGIQLAHVTGILEMVEQLFGMERHVLSVPF